MLRKASLLEDKIYDRKLTLPERFAVATRQSGKAKN
jgi:hypothetical protein